MSMIRNGNIKNRKGEIKLKIDDQKIEKELEEKISKVVDRKDNLELSILLEILKALNRLLHKY